MAKKYLNIREKNNISLYDLGGRVVDVIDKLQSYVLDYGEDTILTIEEDPYSDVPHIEISWLRKETDEEREKRLAKQRKEREREKKRKEKEKKRLRREYERLKKMFEKES